MKTTMGRREFLKASAAGFVIAGVKLMSPGTEAYAREPKTVQFPGKQTGGNTLIQLLEKRRSSREFSPQPLPAAVLSNMLWAPSA